MSAPEKIWNVTPDKSAGRWCSWTVADSVEYTRSDLVPQWVSVETELPPDDRYRFVEVCIVRGNDDWLQHGHHDVMTASLLHRRLSERWTHWRYTEPPALPEAPCTD